MGDEKSASSQFVFVSQAAACDTHIQIKEELNIVVNST